MLISDVGVKTYPYPHATGDPLPALLAEFAANGWRVKLADDGEYMTMANGVRRRFGGDWTAVAEDGRTEVDVRDPTPAGALRRALAGMRAATGREG